MSIFEDVRLRHRPLTTLRQPFQAATARMGFTARFAAVGVLGTLVNLLVMALMVHGVVDIGYVPAAVLAAEVSILHNFVLQEQFVFRNLRDGAGSWGSRLTQHQLFNSAEALVRLPFLILLVDLIHVWALLAQAVTLAVAFAGRFLFTSRVVYRHQHPDRHRAVEACRRHPPRSSVLFLTLGIVGTRVGKMAQHIFSPGQQHRSQHLPYHRSFPSAKAAPGPVKSRDQTPCKERQAS